MIFIELVERLQNVTGPTLDIMDLIQAINKDEFLVYRTKIIEALNLKPDDFTQFSGDFGKEVELGDVSDGIIDTTFSIFPQGTDINKVLDEEARKQWCGKILEAVDYLVSKS